MFLDTQRNEEILDAKKRYEQFCISNYVPIFSQPWWMNVVCGPGKWDVFLVNSGGKDLAAMPYYLDVVGGIRKITKPKLTQNNGIIISYPINQKYHSKLDYEEKIVNKICDQIELLNIDLYEQQYHYSFENWLPFLWRGYNSAVRYTYVIENTSNISGIEQDFSPNARNMIRKAMRGVSVTENIGLEEFYKLNEKTYQKQGMKTPFSFELISNIYDECKSRNCCKLLAAVDNSNNIHSAGLLVWDSASVYFLVNASDPVFKSSQANSLVIYESIKTANALNRKFDFEGSVIKSIEKAFRQFGAKQKQYYRIYKEFNSK